MRKKSFFGQFPTEAMAGWSFSFVAFSVSGECWWISTILRFMLTTAHEQSMATHGWKKGEKRQLTAWACCRSYRLTCFKFALCIKTARCRMGWDIKPETQGWSCMHHHHRHSEFLTVLCRGSTLKFHFWSLSSEVLACLRWSMVQWPALNVQCSMTSAQCSMLNDQRPMFNEQGSMIHNNVQCYILVMQCLEDHEPAGNRQQIFKKKLLTPN